MMSHNRDLLQSLTDSQIALDILKRPKRLTIINSPRIDTRIPFTHTDPLNVLLTQMSERIHTLQLSDFDAIYRSPHGDLFIKDLRGVDDAYLNPIHRFEAEIQALRYTRGILILISHLPTPDGVLKKAVFDIIQTYHIALANLNSPAAATQYLGEEFIKLIENHLGVSTDQARWQLTMARDLANLLETHLTTCTITSTPRTETVMISQLVTLQRHHYQQEFTAIKDKIWFQETCRIAGLPLQADTNWLARFFETHLEQLAAKGTPSLPSSRWLPLPANVIHEKLFVFHQENRQLQSTTQFFRLGVIVPYEVRVLAERERLAKSMLKSLVQQLLEERIIEYKKKYQDFIDPNHFPFFINYQTLLTPLYLESYLPHKENSAEFIGIIKNALIQLSYDADILAIGKRHGAELLFCHTNSAINKHADWVSVKKFDQDRTVYHAQKRPALETLHRRRHRHLIENHATPIDAAIDQRLQSFRFFLMAEKRNGKYHGLDAFQNNTFLAALEFLMLADQSLTFIGCKSSRDRTGIFLSAIKTIMENPTAMHHWPTLEKGIIHTLTEGHPFRSMSHHSGVVKVKAVRHEYHNQLSKQLQANIKLMKPFSKNLTQDDEHKKIKHGPGRV